MRILDAGNVGYPGELPVAERAAAAAGPPASPERGRRDDAERHVAVDLEAEERGPHGHATRVVLGAVDGVDDPTSAGSRRLISALLLSQHAVRGPSPREAIADHCL